MNLAAQFAKVLGQPKIWKTPELMGNEILLYFKEVEELKMMPTKAGLSLHLNTSRKVLGDYIRREGYGPYVSAAYKAIEVAWSQRLAGAVPTGSIFYLKAAFHYKDRYDVTSDDKPIEGNKITFQDFKKINAEIRTDEPQN